MWFIYTVVYYSAIKNSDFMKLAVKWMELEKYHPELGNPATKKKKKHGMHTLINGYYPRYNSQTT
jgi:hypothetical protein